jgi:hypothetical protein
MTTRETADIHRKGLHADLDVVLDHLQAARDERHAIGFPTSTISGGRGGAELTSVEAAADQPDWATGWLAEARDAQNHLVRAANMARAHWPAVTKGTTVAGVTIGQRGSSEICGLCKLPAPSGTDENGQPLVRRIDGIAYHNVSIPGVAGACFWQVWRQRRRTT